MARQAMGGAQAVGRGLVGVGLLALAPILAGAAAQQPGAPAAPGAAALAAADSALLACEALANGKDPDGKAVSAAADAATKLYEDAGRSGAAPADVLTGRASVISRCRIPVASFFRKGSLVEESSDLVRQAIALDSLHLGARFLLAMNDYNVPAFLGRTEAAIQELEWIVAHYGVRAGPVVGGMSYLDLGDVYLRAGRKADAAAIWRKGQALFPARTADFTARLQKLGDAAGAGSASAAGVFAPAPGAGQSPVVAALSSNKSPQALALAPLVVQASSFSVDDPRSGTALKRMDVVSMPGGMADVLQVFESVPGVTRVTEGSDLYVRGGEASEAPVLVDGVRLPYAGTFESLDGGMSGVLESSVLRKAVFSSGAFSARYGNALSGILDVETDGRPPAREAHVGVNLVSVTGVAKEPLGNEGFWAAGRVVETTALLLTQGRRADFPMSPREAQGMAAFVTAPRPGVELKGELLGEADGAHATAHVLDYDGEARASGHTATALASARVLSGDGTRALRAVASASLRGSALALGVLDRERTDRAAALRVDGDLAPTSALRLRAGVEGTALDAREAGQVPTAPSLATDAPTAPLSDSTVTTAHAGGYVEAELRAGSALALTVGGRADRLPGEDTWTADPRAAVALRLGDWTVRAGGGVFHQGRWRIGYRLPDPGSPGGVATRARHAVLGAERDGKLALRAEAFLKRYDDYVPPSALPSESIEQAEEGPAARAGDARGLDALARWTGSGRLTGWLSYSLLRSRVQLADGRWVRSPYDVTHSVTGVTRLAVGDSWEVGTTLRYGTGRPYTSILGATTAGDGSARPIYGALDAQRLPDYFRADARVTRLGTLHGRALAAYVEALNVLDRKNVTGYSYDASFQAAQPQYSFFSHRTLVLGLDVTL